MKSVFKKIMGWIFLILVIIGTITLPFAILGLIAGAFKDDK